MVYSGEPWHLMATRRDRLTHRDDCAWLKCVGWRTGALAMNPVTAARVRPVHRTKFFCTGTYRRNQNHGFRALPWRASRGVSGTGLDYGRRHVPVVYYC